MLCFSDVSSSSRSIPRAVPFEAILVLALAAAGIGACSAPPLQVPDGGTAGVGGGGPSGSDGGGAGSTSPNPATCTVVVPSDYDQSCAVDEDCVIVGQRPKCPVTDCSGCSPGAINKSAMARYKTALSQPVVGGDPVIVCSCPCETGFALCRSGKCQPAPCGPPRADTLPACSNAGGTCGYVANTICNTKGPSDACAFSDELCCLD
jgi:hypothetical protein